MKTLLKPFLVCACFAAGLLTASAQSNTITIQVNEPGATISTNLFGIFFEEINFGGDGGLYAEMVRNRAFNNSATAASSWNLVTTGTGAGSMAVDATHPLNSNKPVSLNLTMSSGAGSVGAANYGYFGMALQSGATYNLSLYAMGASGYAGPVVVQLQSTDGSTTYAQTSFGGLTTNWQKFTASLVSSTTDTNSRIVVSITNAGTVWLDEVSLFPQATFNSRSNGFRPDIANMLVGLTPSFMRYPGGNFIESNNATNAVRWKKTIGDTALRPGHRNDAWGYWSTDGFGLDEYMQLCSDLGMTPLYGINAGLMLGYNGATNNTIPISQMGPWVQDALDLIQYSNGDTNTTWGAMRVANGHPTPYNLQYLEIGNENGGPLYDARYTLFYDAITSNYPNVHLISPVWGTPSQPVSRPVEIQDEHYYPSAATLISMATQYDSYSRSGPKVFVGEYATRPNGTNGNLAGALGEAAFMTGMERNSDIVLMASYAPLFGNLNTGAFQWQPDLIYFDDSRVFGTPSYYNQQLFSNHRGNVVLPTAVTSVTANTLFVSSSFVQASNVVIVKAVNVSASPLSTTINLNGVNSVASSAALVQLTGASATIENTFAAPTNVYPVTNSINNAATSFTVNLPANSVSIYGISVSGINAINSLQFQAASPLNVGQEAQSSLIGHILGTSTTINLAGNYGVNYSSLNTNIALVTPGGLVIGTGVGTVGIVASYNSLSVTQSVQVVAAGPTTLIHRYSFNDGTANDSIGSANGTFFNTSGQASISSGQLNLVGNTGDYVDLGPGVITTSTISNGAVTFEAWASFGATNGAWARLFDFGNISGTSGGNYIFLAANNGANGGSTRLAVSDTIPGGNEAGITFGYNLLGQTNVHLVAVFNPTPARQFLGLYTNGELSASTSTGTKYIASISNVFSFIGHSLWSGDAWLHGSIDEFRIYNGELDKYQIAASFQAGPNATNLNVGTVVSFALSPGPMPVALSSQRQIAAYLNFTLASDVNVVGDPNLTLSSDNTNVATINSSGTLFAASVGTANLTGVYNYISGNTTNIFTNSVQITVQGAPPGFLTHRYSFNDGTANDSVGTANGTLHGNAIVTGNQLVIPNTNSTAPAPDYLQLPAGIVTNNLAVTIEAWATFSPSQYTWANLFDFGNRDGSGNAEYDIHLCAHSSTSSTIIGISDSDNANADYQFLDLGSGSRLDGSTNIHLVVVFDPPEGYQTIYANGVQLGIDTNVTIQMSGVHDVRNLIGSDNWPDPGMKGSIDEFRIYNGVLHAGEIAATQILGPNVVLSTARPVIGTSASAGNLTLSWPLVSAGFTLQSRASAASGPWTNVVPAPQIVGGQWQSTVPITGTAQYFRLQR